MHAETYITLNITLKCQWTWKLNSNKLALSIINAVAGLELDFYSQRVSNLPEEKYKPIFPIKLTYLLAYNSNSTNIMIQTRHEWSPVLRCRRPSSGTRIVLLDIKGGIRNVSQSMEAHLELWATVACGWFSKSQHRDRTPTGWRRDRGEISPILNRRNLIDDADDELGFIHTP